MNHGDDNADRIWIVPNSLWRRPWGQDLIVKLLDELQPGLQLVVDDAWLMWAFGFYVGAENCAARRRAEKYAKNNGCGFIFDPCTTRGTFIRAYPREDNTERHGSEHRSERDKPPNT
jgi:hypothetical protein